MVHLCVCVLVKVELLFTDAFRYRMDPKGLSANKTKQWKSALNLTNTQVKQVCKCFSITLCLLSFHPLDDKSHVMC